MKTFSVILLPLLIVTAACGEVITPDFSEMRRPASWIPSREVERPTLGLALSGGGLRGLAHIGVLEALEEAEIEVDYIAGVSIGALVGALYASGYSPAEIRQMAWDIDWGELFVDRPSRRTLFLNRKKSSGRHQVQVSFKNWKPYIPPAFTSGQKMYMLLEDLFMGAVYHPVKDFDRLKIPFRAVATDLKSGEGYLICRGDMVQAVRAAAAIPPVFSPVEFEGRSLVDGGAVENIPVFTAKEMGADIVLAVDVTSPLQQEVNEPWEIANQITTIMISEGMKQALEVADIALKPVPDDIGSFDFSAADSIPDLGRKASEAVIDRLKNLMKIPAAPDSTAPRAFRHIAYQISGKMRIQTADTTVFQPGCPVSNAEIKRYLTRLYREYELLDAAAEISGDTLIIKLTPPPAYRYIEVRGNSVIPDSAIIAAVHSPPEEPLLHSQGAADLERIIRLYRERGYALARIKEVRLTGDTLVITIDEGIVEAVRVEGGRKWALNELRVKPGEPFDWNRARSGLRRLYGTDYYETVRIKLEPAGDGCRAALVLERRPFPMVRIGERYDRERSWSVFLEILSEDILMSGAGVKLMFAPGEKDKKAALQFNTDKVLGTDVFNNLEFYYSKSEFDAYDSRHHRRFGADYHYEVVGGMQKIGQNLRRWGLLSAGVKLEKVLSHHPADLERDQRAVSLILESEVDTYDRYPFPHTGNSLRFAFQTSARFYPYGGRPTYSSFCGDIQRWFPLKKRYAMMLRVRGGYAEPTVPTWEKFSLGGMNDFAGLHIRELLGNQLLAGSAALRFDLLSRFLAEAFVTARYDFGQIVDGVENLAFERSFFRQGLSLAFSLNTLLGPMEVSYGWAAPHKDIPDQGLLLFSLGHEF